MKLPYSNDHYVYLETMDDVQIFNWYISTALGKQEYHPLDYYSGYNNRLPSYAYIIRSADIYSTEYFNWSVSNLPPPHRTLIPIDALFNYEKYPEYFI